MQGHYGTRWLNMWKIGQSLPDGQDAGVVNAMYHWAEKLAYYQEKPDAIGWALRNLPAEPPSLPQFVELLKGYTGNNTLKLPHKLTQEDREKGREQIRQIMAKLGVTLSDNGDGLKRPTLSTHHETPSSEQD